MTKAKALGRAALDGYRRLLLPLAFVGAVLLLSAVTAVVVAMPLYLVATRATVAYNVALAVLAAAGLATVAGRSLIRRARTSGDAAGYARRLAIATVWLIVRLAGGLAVAYLALLAFRFGPATGIVASVIALSVIALLAGVGRNVRPPVPRPPAAP